MLYILYRLHGCKIILGINHSSEIERNYSESGKNEIFAVYLLYDFYLLKKTFIKSLFFHNDNVYNFRNKYNLNNIIFN